jgi:UDP-glucose 4-epimerase
MELGEGQFVAVTGGAGFIGSHTVDRLVDAGCQVVVIDNFRTGKRENLARWAGDPRVAIVCADVSDGLFAPLAGLTERFGPVQRIVHLAAQTAVTYSVDNPVEDARVNYVGTLQVLEYARATGVKKVVFASSAAVYGEVEAVPVRERDHCAPLSPYGINKLSSELQLRYYTAVHAIPTTALRFFNVYGPRQDPKSPYSGVISIFVDRAVAGVPLTIFGDGQQTRDFVFVGDVSRIVAEACLSDRGSGAVVNIGTGHETTVVELAAAIKEICGSPSPVEHAPPRAGEIVRSVAEVERASEIFGFRAEVPLAVGLQQTISWLRG